MLVRCVRWIFGGGRWQSREPFKRSMIFHRQLCHSDASEKGNDEHKSVPLAHVDARCLLQLSHQRRRLSESRPKIRNGQARVSATSINARPAEKSCRRAPK